MILSRSYCQISRRRGINKTFQTIKRKEKNLRNVCGIKVSSSDCFESKNLLLFFVGGLGHEFVFALKETLNLFYIIKFVSKFVLKKKVFSLLKWRA